MRLVRSVKIYYKHVLPNFKMEFDAYEKLKEEAPFVEPKVNLEARKRSAFGDVAVAAASGTPSS